jgi:hypothetical protein
MEVNMNRRKMMLATLVGFMTAAGAPVLYAQDDKADPALAKALEDTKISLQQGLTAAESKGRPISAKFEIEDGKLQLSVYTAKGGKFSEVIMDLATGKIAKSEPITEGGDLTEAKAQSGAMAKTKTSLKAAVDKAVRASGGFRAVSATPTLKNSRDVASVTLLKGNQMKTVEESLK